MCSHASSLFWLMHEWVCRGTLPGAWGNEGVLDALGELHMTYTKLTGSLPNDWAGTPGQNPMVNLNSVLLDGNTGLTGAPPPPPGAPCPRCDALYGMTAA